MAIEYVFFDADLRERFVQGLAARALAHALRDDPIEGLVVALAGDPDDATLDTLEADYQALMDEQLLRAEQRPDWVVHRTAGLRVTLADGREATLRLPAAVARPLLERFSAQEAHELVQAIADSLQHPIDGPLCRKA